MNSWRSASELALRWVSYPISCSVTTPAEGKGAGEQFGLSPGQTLQVIALPGRIELVPTRSPSELRGFLQGNNTFQREDARL